MKQKPHIVQVGVIAVLLEKVAEPVLTVYT